MTPALGYRVRVRHVSRPIQGTIELGVSTLGAARALGAAWQVALGDRWIVSLLDLSGGVERL